MGVYKLGLYEKAMPGRLSFREKLSAAGQAGYDFLEMSLDESEEKQARLDWSRNEVLALRHASEDAGIPIRTICLSGHRKFPLGDPDPATRKQGLVIMEKSLILAAELGVRVIQLAGYDVYYKPGSAETARLFEEGLGKCVEMAARYGVILGFETMETPFMNTVGKAMTYVDKIDSPWLQVYPDSGNLWNASLEYGVPVTEDLKLGRGHLVALHLKESRPGEYREVPYGAGHVDFPSVIEAALQLGVRIFNAEFWHLGEENWQQILSDNCRFLRSRFPAGFDGSH